MGVLCHLFFPVVDKGHVPDKVALQQSASVEAHTHLAHSVVRYLGLTAPSDLEEYGIMSAGDLVNMISRVRNEQVSPSSFAHPFRALVYHEHIYPDLALTHTNWCHCVATCRVYKPFVPPKCSHRIPS